MFSAGKKSNLPVLWKRQKNQIFSVSLTYIHRGLQENVPAYYILE
jgi:hypothetical protein